MVAIESTLSLPNAADIPGTKAGEAYTLLKTEFARFMQLVSSLNPDDWTKPTACTAWNVRDMLAHQAGGYASGTSYREMIRQYSARPGPGMLPEDATNALQLRERAGRTPAELIAELQSVGPTAIQKWAYQFRFAKFITHLVSVPHAVAGGMTFEYLMWIIHSRDTWMHRLDICRATGRAFEQTPAHDGRIAALVVLDSARQIAKKLGGRAIVLELTGLSGGTWQIGSGETGAVVRMDALDFCIFASGRYNFEDAMQRAVVSGDQSLVERALENLLVLF